MGRYNVPEISADVFLVGVKDWNRKIFDALIPLPQGTSYNSYLIRGKEKTALIDTVSPGFEGELTAKIKQMMVLTDLDYIVMNHAEPDHAGAISHILQMSDKTTLLATAKGAKMIQRYYKVPEEKIKIVKDGDTVELGGKTLRFIEAPFLHWPETMFTYLVENKVLFPCDFFGAHTAFGLYDEDVEEIIPFAKRYFGEIMMPFRTMAIKALEKIKELEIKIIAPSHGPIYKKPERILEAYRKWTSGETREKAIVLYISMLGSTETMIKAMVETLFSEDIEVSLYNLLGADIGEIAKDFVDSRAIVLGMLTMLGGMHPLAGYATYLIKAFRPPLKYGVILSSHGFGGGAVQQAREIFGHMQIEVIGTLDVDGLPTDDDCQNIAEIGKQLSHKMKG